MRSKSTLSDRKPPARLSARLPLVATILLVFVVGCVYDPQGVVSIGSPSETVSSETPGFGEGPVERVVVLHVPAGALEGATEATIRIGATTLSPEPFPPVEFAIADPVNESMIVDSVGNPGEEFAMPIPQNCENGCDFEIPVTITQVGEGETPRFGWSAALFFDYEGGNTPESAEAMTTPSQQLIESRRRVRWTDPGAARPRGWL